MTTNKRSKYEGIILGEPKKVYSVTIHQRKTKGQKENCRSFMIYDYEGNTDIDMVKEKLDKRIRNCNNRRKLK